MFVGFSSVFCSPVLIFRRWYGIDILRSVELRTLSKPLPSLFPLSQLGTVIPNLDSSLITPQYQWLTEWLTASERYYAYSYYSFRGLRSWFSAEQLWIQRHCQIKSTSTLSPIIFNSPSVGNLLSRFYKKFIGYKVSFNPLRPSGTCGGARILPKFQSWVTISNDSISNTYLKYKMPFSILYFK